MKAFNNICIIIPVYDNESTIMQVIDAAARYVNNIIVVNDGSTDGTEHLIMNNIHDVKIISYINNRGKGYALKQGFKYAEKNGFSHALTLDADGQHYADDIPKFLAANKSYPDNIIVGSRNLQNENMPAGNTFANKFSNFWFHLQTLHKLPDTQSGYRLYPLDKIKNIRLLCNRYDFEIEILVKSAWRGIGITPIPVNVYYAPENERISHFKTKDFVKISFLNSFLTIAAFVFGYWSMLIHKLIK